MAISFFAKPLAILFCEFSPVIEDIMAAKIKKNIDA